MPKFVLTYCASWLVLSCALAQNITYVTPTGAGSQDGSSWSNATPDLYTALLSAKAIASTASPQEIWVAQGTYTTLSGSLRIIDRSLSFEIGAHVQLLGGFNGTESSKLQANTSNLVTLSGDLDSDGTSAGNSYNVVFCDDCGSAAGLSTVTIAGGMANGPAGFDARGRAGAGLYLFGENGRQANLIVTDVTFIDNEAEGKGGAVYVKGSAAGQSSPVFERCAFLSNRAGLQAGGVFVDGSVGGTANAKFIECRFEGNATVNAVADGAGGAMFISAPAGGTANCDFDRCLFSNNATVVTLNAGATGANGGAIYVSTIDNSAGNGQSILTFDNTIFQENTAYSGGAVYANGVTLATLRNCTVFENQAVGVGGSGAGIYLNSSTADVANHVSYGNLVSADPDRGSDFRFVNGTLTLDYAVVESATAALLFSRASTSNTDTYTAGSSISYGTDPQLSVATGYPEPASATSPAIDAGNNSLTPSSGLDYTGGPRIVNAIVDLGAVESPFAPLPVDLVSFAAEAGPSRTQVVWTSATELNLSGYQLLRSADGETFSEVTFVPAMELGSYSFTDRGVADGQTYYYQLVSVDLDGTTYLSDVVVVHLPKGDLDTLLTRLYPNPSSGLLTVEIGQASLQRTVYVSILDVQGRKLRMWPLTSDGTHTLTLHDLPNGNYLVRLDAGARSQSEQFTIKH